MNRFSGAVEVRTGVRMPYFEQGDPSGMPLVLVHAVGDSQRIFEGLLDRLPASVHAFAPTMRGPGDASWPPSGYLLDASVQESLKVPAFVWRETVKGILEDDFSAELGRIAVPTLVIWGDGDALLPREDEEALARLIRMARLVVYPGAGHVFYWEDPTRAAADLASFVEELAS